MYFVIQLNKTKNANNNLSYCTALCNSKIENGKLSCDCGNDIDIFDWRWKRDDSSVNFQLDLHGLEVTFHPVYSVGTALVSGTDHFQQNMHYYWEIKMISKLYGTDVMVGVATDKSRNCKSRFCSILGLDDQSWGYSYHGFIQHSKLTRKYGKPFGLGCIVGVHLDMCSGKLEYYLNRKPLGIAFDGLRNKKLYPTVCSTAAKSAMRLNCAVSQEETLQMLCLKCVQQHPSLFEKYKTIPGLYRYYSQKYFWMVPRDETKTTEEEEEENLHLMTMNNSIMKNRSKKRYSEYQCSEPNKKITRNNGSIISQTECDTSIPSTSLSNSNSGNHDLDNDREISKILYDFSNDSDIDSVQGFDNCDTNDNLNVMFPSDDSDSS